MAVSLLGRLAARAPTPVFVARGSGAEGAIADLLAAADVEPVASPRHATVLVVAGTIAHAHVEALQHVHDQVPHPRSTVWFRPDGAAVPDGWSPVRVDDPAALHATVRRTHRDLVTGDHDGEPPLLGAEHPVDWRGTGDHGQGGEGMMGGRPYGRPMPMTDDDVRDGLSLDAVHLRLGPFLPGLPSGLVLDTVFQGDVLQSVTVAGNPFVDERPPAPSPTPRPVRQVEFDRARIALRRLADLLWLQGLDALAARTRRLARDLAVDDAATVRALHRRLVRTRSLWGATSGVGVVPDDVVTACVGPVARAAGGAGDDPRSEDDAYADLGFAPVRRDAGDAAARWQLWLDDAAQSLELAAAAGDRPTTVVPARPHAGADTLVVLAALGRMTTGMEWGDAITTIATLDLDLRAAASLGAAVRT